jgi:signal peptidase I
MGDPGGGTIPVSAVIGRAFIIIWPPSRWRILPIPATFQQPALTAAAATGSAGGDDAVVAAQARPTVQTVPLVLGFAGAIPLTWLQRRVRTRAVRRRRRGRDGRSSPPEPADPPRV